MPPGADFVGLAEARTLAVAACSYEQLNSSELYRTVVAVYAQLAYVRIENYGSR